MAFNQSSKSLKNRLLEAMENNGDVTFLVGLEDNEQEEIRASTFILQASSSVFNVMFNGVWRSQDNPDPISLPDVEPKIFRIFLEALVTEDFKFSNLNRWNLMDYELFRLLDVGRKYDVNFIVRACKVCLQFIMSSNHPRAAVIFETARLYNEPDVAANSLTVIEHNALEVFQSLEFKNLAKETLLELLKNDKMIIDELSLFQAGTSWAAGKCTEENIPVSGASIRSILGGLLFLIRFPLITPENFATHVAPTKVLNEKEMLDVFLYTSVSANEDKKFAMARNLKFSIKPRAWISPNRDVAQVQPRQLASSSREAGSQNTLDSSHFIPKQPRLTNNSVVCQPAVRDNGFNYLDFDFDYNDEEPEIDDDGF